MKKRFESFFLLSYRLIVKREEGRIGLLLMWIRVLWGKKGRKWSTNSHIHTLHPQNKWRHE
jgi:hypothetical protein